MVLRCINMANAGYRYGYRYGEEGTDKYRYGYRYGIYGIYKTAAIDPGTTLVPRDCNAA